MQYRTPPDVTETAVAEAIFQCTDEQAQWRNNDSFVLNDPLPEIQKHR